MKIEQYKLLPLKSLRFDVARGRKLATDPEVQELAHSLKTNGLFHPLLVRAFDKLVICGQRRGAAARILKWEVAPCCLCEAADDELTRLRLTENLHREARTSEQLDDMRAEYVRTRASEIKDLRIKGNGSPKLPGRPSSGITEAQRELAAVEGTDPSTIKKSVGRAKKRLAVVPPPAEAPASDSWTILPPRAQLLQKHLRVLHAKLVAAQGYITSELLDGIPPGTADAMVPAELRRIIHRAAEEVRNKTPERTCVYCKLLPDRRPHCPACKGDGYLLSYQLRDVPAELLREGAEAGVFVGHKFVLLADYGKKRTA